MLFRSLMGFFNELKKIYVGISIIELQFVICGAVHMFFVATKELPYTPIALDYIASYGNFMLVCFDEPNIWNVLITMLLPLSTLLGVQLKKLFNRFWLN